MSQKSCKQVPVFQLGLCCGYHDCLLLRLSISDPIIEDTEDGLESVAYFPLEESQKLVDEIRKFAAFKGIQVK